MSHCSVISQAKLAQRTERIDRGYSLLSPVHDDDLPHLSANSTEIVRHIKAGDWTSRRVLEAFVRSLVTIQYKANPVTEVMLEEAFKRADELDLQFKLDGLLVGPRTWINSFDSPSPLPLTHLLSRSLFVWPRVLRQLH